MDPVLLDLALFCAMTSVRPGDHVDHARFARLLRHVQFAASGGREEAHRSCRPRSKKSSTGVMSCSVATRID